MKDYRKIEGWITYVPATDDNRLDENPVTVEILPLKVKETRDLAKTVAARRAKGGGVITDSVEKNTRLLRSHVRNIRNLSIEGRPITTMEELEASNLTQLYNEIEEAVNDISVLDEGDVKNFRRQSDGQRESEPGTAASATTN